MRKIRSCSINKAAKGLALIQLPVLFLFCMMFVGVTAGFLVSGDSVTNRLSCGHNTAGITENYNPPEAFAEGETYVKEVAVKNEGSVPCYVRVFAEFEDPEIRSNTSVLVDTENWSEKQSDGFYYYSGVLDTGETTPPLVKSITAKAAITDFKMICYSETVQAEGFDNAKTAFAAIK